MPLLQRSNCGFGRYPQTSTLDFFLLSPPNACCVPIPQRRGRRPVFCMSGQAVSVWATRPFHGGGDCLGRRARAPSLPAGSAKPACEVAAPGRAGEPMCGGGVAGEAGGAARPVAGRAEGSGGGQPAGRGQGVANQFGSLFLATARYDKDLCLSPTKSVNL